MDVKKELQRYILETFLLGKNPEELMGDTPLLSSGIIDSISMVNLIDFIEREFQIEINPWELNRESFETITSISELILQKRPIGR